LRISDDEILHGRFSNTRQNILAEIGRELNPAALVSIGVQYSPKSELTFKTNGKEYKLDCKPNFAVGVKFTVDVKVLLQME
jgi:hypothetical protein